MRGKLFFGAATAALLMFTAGAAAQTADQPGDASTQARFTGDTIEGEITAGDVDWYRMSVEHGQRYSFALVGLPEADGAALDPVLSIYDANGAHLAYNDDAGASLNSALNFTPQQSGEVFVEARAFSETQAGRYRLAATSGPLPEDAVGNDANTGARISAGRPTAGEIEYEGDVDWYRFSARTGQLYRITLTGAEGAATPLGDPFLRVLDAEGGELAVNDDTDGSLNSGLTFIPRTSGDVFIEASAFSGAYSGAYTLNITAERLPTDSVGGDRNTRGRLSIGQSTDGSLDFPSDTDWYRVRLEEGQSYRFTMTSAGDAGVGDPLIRLYDANGAEIAMDDDGGEGLNAYLEFTAATTGNYFVEAHSFNPEGTGGYTIAARAGDIPADTTTDMSLSAHGDWRQGVLAPAGDRDWYRVDLEQGQAMRLSLENPQSADGLGDPYLVLYGPDGAEVARDDDGGDGLNAWLEYTAVTAGSHYVEARGFAEDAAGAYAISLTPGEIGASFDNADYLTPNGEGRASIIGAEGDSDWFMVELIEGRPYRFNLMGADVEGLADPYLTLYDSQGNEVAADDDGGTGLNAYLSFVSVTGGTYFASVSGYGGSGTGRYWLNVTDTDVPGHINTDEFLDASAGDDRLSRIDMSGDLDVYRVQLEAGVTYTIEVSGAGDSPLADPFLAIMNEASEVVASDDDSGTGLDARLRFTPESSAGYLIQASGLGGSTGSYRVSIVRQ